jgi:hypothetical protein
MGINLSYNAIYDLIKLLVDDVAYNRRLNYCEAETLKDYCIYVFKNSDRVRIEYLEHDVNIIAYNCLLKELAELSEEELASETWDFASNGIVVFDISE